MATLIRIYWNAVYGGLGGLLGWMLFGAFGWKLATTTPLFLFITQQHLNFFLMGFIIGGSIAYLIVAVEAIRDRSFARFARLSTYGAVLGAIGGGIGSFIGNMLKNFMDDLLGAALRDTPLLGVAVAMFAFSIGWCVMGMAVGMSEGIAARSLGKFSYGMIGGALGGFIGGLQYGFFIQISQGSETYVIGALGLVILGACIGSLTALVKAVFLPASVKVMRGWQEGREYPLDKVANTLGRKEHVDIPLFRDMKVEKEHAFIRRLGKRFVLFNNNAPPENTLVNEQPVPKAIDLFDGDRIQLGNVVLRFQARAAVNRQRPARRPPSAAPAAGKDALAQMLGK